MARKEMSGLVKRGGVWDVNKRFRGQRIRESTGSSDLAEAESYLVHRLEQIRQAEIYGVRPRRIFKQAATRYLREKTKTSLEQDAHHLKLLDPYIGNLPLEAVHMGSLQPFIESRRQKKLNDGTFKVIKARTINYALQVVRHILNLASSEWLDEHGMTWLQHAPKIKLLSESDKREPFPLSWKEQEKLFAELPQYLRSMALFAVNSGCREAEICGLRWDEQVAIPELNTSVFIIPAHRVKNREDRLVVLNSIARNVIEEQRGAHPEFVFVNSQGGPVQRMCREAWRKARKRAGFPDVRVHDLKHTFGRRLRAAGVSFEDRQDLLGHKSGRITTHYSAPELINLIQASERVCAQDGHKMATMTVLRKKNLALVAAK